jgi:X-Pro dipeptidyl-peptidase (S15 family)
MEMSRARHLAGYSLWFCILLISVVSPCAFALQAPSPSPVTVSGDRPSAGPPVPLAEFHEDWTTLTIKGSDLHARHPILGEKDDVPGTTFIRERYQMLWRPGDPLDVFVVRPRGVAKAPVILYLYSFPQDTDRFKNDRWCQTVTSNGFAAVGFVAELTGQRIHDRPVKEWFVSELQESLATSVHDVQMILDYLATRSDVDMDRVGMFGVGSGGSVAILAAAADPRIKAIELLSPWGDWPDWLAKSSIVPENERAAYLKPEFLARVAPLDPVLWLAKLKAQAIRIENVRKTPTIPDECQVRIEAAAPAASIVDQFGDARAFYPVSAGGRVFDWLENQLQPDAKAATVADNSPGVHYHPPAGQPSLPPLPAPK